MKLMTTIQWKKVDIKTRLWRIEDLEKYINWCEKQQANYKPSPYWKEWKEITYKEYCQSFNDYDKRIAFAYEEIRRIKQSLNPKKIKKEN